VTPRLTRAGAAVGEKAQLVRSRMLDELYAQISSCVPWRDVTVMDIAAAVNRSPATFYQYWPDVETATVEMMQDRIGSAHLWPDHLHDIVRLMRREGYRVPEVSDRTES
jgi:AcrR family transcriptional regulator